MKVGVCIWDRCCTGVEAGGGVVTRGGDLALGLDFKLESREGRVMDPVVALGAPVSAGVRVGTVMEAISQTELVTTPRIVPKQKETKRQSDPTKRHLLLPTTVRAPKLEILCAVVDVTTGVVIGRRIALAYIATITITQHQIQAHYPSLSNLGQGRVHIWMAFSRCAGCHFCIHLAFNQ
jgi:hypothetical protein